MRITKVYTRGGDKGQTSLVGGARVRKDHVRIETYGTIDELNAIVGLVRAFSERSGAPVGAIASLEAKLRRVQNDLFDVGTDLATPASARWEGMHRVGDDEVTRVEEWIDEMNEDLPALEEFILPGGGPVGAFFHQARTVCRRAERRVLALMETEQDVGDGPMRYLNRLSDWLFVAGRWAAAALGESETYWEPAGRRD
jgi:cob(I)alamin adenosyltransferase